MTIQQKWVTGAFELILASAICPLFGQSNVVKTSGPCSSAIIGNGNTITLTCNGTTGAKLREIQGKIEQLLSGPNGLAILLETLRRVESRTDNLKDLLVPANEADPMRNCAAPETGLKLILGNNGYGVNTDGPFLRVGKNELSLSRVGDGIAVSAKVFSEDGKIIASIEHNQFKINRNNYFDMRSPDPSTLIVTDQEGEEAINFRLLNTTTARFKGRLFTAQGALVLIDETGIHADGGLTVSNSCVMGRGRALYIDGPSEPGGVLMFRDVAVPYTVR